MTDPIVARDAVIESDYRYCLTRSWDMQRPILVVTMLNPSTADANKDDPTLKRLIHFASSWGYGALHIINLYAWRSPSPNDMFAAPNRIGPRNEFYWDEACTIAKKNGGQLLVAWGNDGNYEGQAKKFANIATGKYQLDLICMGQTLSGSPKHPMARGRGRVSNDQKPIPWV